jgi:tetratricopeptide (TPR) repeat protein
MKRLLILTLLLCGTLFAAAQTTKEDYLRRYNNLVERVGITGVGVETLLDNWAADYPEDDLQMLARFAFCFARSQSSQLIELDRERYLGNAPLLPMTDSLGVKHNYFEDTVFDDDLFADALQMIDQAIAAKSWKLDYRFMKINAMLAYEKESPDMTLQQLKALADEHFTRHPAWVYEGVEKVGDEEFCAFMQDYCATIFRIGSDASAEAFKSLSEQMLKYSKNNPLFMNNIGSYWLVKKEYKKAAKQYDAVLKKHPDDLTAIRNGLLTARASKDTKMEKKYLTLMAKYGETEVDRMSAQAKLDVMGKK